MDELCIITGTLEALKQARTTEAVFKPTVATRHQHMRRKIQRHLVQLARYGWGIRSVFCTGTDPLGQPTSPHWQKLLHRGSHKCNPPLSQKLAGFPDGYETCPTCRYSSAAGNLPDCWESCPPPRHPKNSGVILASVLFGKPKGHLLLCTCEFIAHQCFSPMEYITRAASLAVQILSRAR